MARMTGATTPRDRSLKTKADRGKLGLHDSHQECFFGFLGRWIRTWSGLWDRASRRKVGWLDMRVLGKEGEGGGEVVGGYLGVGPMLHGATFGSQPTIII